MLLRLGGLFFLIATVFWLWAIFDSITSDAAQVRNLPKIAWVIVVFLGLEFGAAAWVLLGRPRKQPYAGPRSTLRPRPSGPPGPVGPDDDPDFLRKL
jgi:hypothetical protein